MSDRPTLAAAAAFILLTMGACSSPAKLAKPEGSKISSSSTPSRYCEPVPKSKLVEPMQDVPPLPTGSLWQGVEPGAFGSRVGKVAVPTSLAGLQSFILDGWPSDGWTMGRGESERGLEVEQKANRGDIYVSFRGLNVYCDHGWSVAYLHVTDLAACRASGVECAVSG